MYNLYNKQLPVRLSETEAQTLADYIVEIKRKEYERGYNDGALHSPRQSTEKLTRNGGGY